MSAKDKPTPTGGRGDGGSVPSRNEAVKPADGVDEASHGGGKRNAEKRSSRSLEQTRGGQGAPGEIDDPKAAHRK
jgi:hypothetical protein